MRRPSHRASRDDDQVGDLSWSGLRRRPPAGVFQLKVGLTIRQELINHAAVRAAIWELGAKALPHQLSGVGSWLVALDTAHPCASLVRGSKR